MAPESEREKKRTIYCHGCSEAGGADRDIYHLPPECKSTNPEPTLICSEVVERLLNEALRRHGDAIWLDPPTAELILHSWRERRVQELEAEHELFLSQLKTALGIADDGRVWFGTGLLARAETLVKREAEWREQIRKGAKHDSGS